MNAPRKRKLIEVALPLDEINAACKADKDRKSGTIRNLHKWFAPMPMPAWRALLFCALVDDPGEIEPRLELLDLVKRLMKNGADEPDERDIAMARRIMEANSPDGLPTVLDPFCGAGSTLVEAQRLGLRTRGSDLNPVPVLITRTLTQLLPPLRGRGALHDGTADALLIQPPSHHDEHGLRGLLIDIEHYAKRVLALVDEAVGDSYPKHPNEVPVAWLWARTAQCNNPACGRETVLATSWWLSRKTGDMAWLEPKSTDTTISFELKQHQRSGGPPDPPKIGRGGSFTCLHCASTLAQVDIERWATTSGLGMRMLAVASTVDGRREYRLPLKEDVSAVVELPSDHVLFSMSLGPANQYVSPPRFGLTTQADLYTSRQANTMTVFCEAVARVFDMVIADGGDSDWATAITTVLTLAVGRLARASSTLAQWRMRESAHAKAEQAFPRNDLPIFWDFAETYYKGGSVGDWLENAVRGSRAIVLTVAGNGTAVLADARTASLDDPGLVATDPPYFDAIGYADLSDYFYVWHRMCLRRVFPDLYATIVAPKEGELTGFPWVHGGRSEAKQYFVEGFTRTFTNLTRSLRHDLPMIVVYASKEQKGGKEEHTRWSSILEAMIAANLEVTGTWPIHGTGGTRLRGIGANAVATYVVMTARPRDPSASSTSLGEFTRHLRRELGSALRDLQSASILPVDMAQAVMGPGMSIFSRYPAILDQNGHSLSVLGALSLINSVVSEIEEELEGELDPDSQFAIAWWQKHGWSAGTFGEADALARPKGISVDDVVRAGVVSQQPNRVTAIGRDSLDRAWDPVADVRPTAWESVHHLVDRLVDGGGEIEAAHLLHRVMEEGLADSTRTLTYRLATIAASTKRTRDEERYNALIEAWPRLSTSSGISERLF